MDKYLFYDIEVFKHDAFVVFKDSDNNNVAFFHNDFDGIVDVIKDKILVGYNNYWYDDKILTAMIGCQSNKQIKKLNDEIMEGKHRRFNVSRFIKSLDCFQEIDPSKPRLKKVEGNMGKMILESGVGFDIDRKLTPEELEVEKRYCEYDVEMTIEIFKLRKENYFEPKAEIVKMMDTSLQSMARKWNTTTIAANILTGGKNLNEWVSHRVPEDMLNLVPNEAVELWDRVNSFGDWKTSTVTIRDFDNDIEFGFGGLHAVNVKKKRFKDVKLLDVASMYPHIAIELNVLGHGTEIYRKILNERIEIKHKDKLKSEALKLILNSAYGNLNNKYSLLYNPRALYSVCFYGQIALYELAKRLSEFGEIVQCNTDGVAFVTDTDDYKKIWKQWEKDFKLVLELEEYDTWIQKDVNGYVAVAKDGYTLTKGGMVNKYNHDLFFKNNNTRIIDIAIVDYLVKDKDVIDTLTENLDKPHLYQYVLQKSKSFKGIYDDEGNEYQNVNRVFATRKDDYISLHRLRFDGGTAKFPDAPDKMYLWNDDCDKIENFYDIVDLNHYYQLIKQKLELWGV